jgi:hypothetical protein
MQFKFMNSHDLETRNLSRQYSALHYSRPSQLLVLVPTRIIALSHFKFSVTGSKFISLLCFALLCFHRISK